MNSNVIDLSGKVALVTGGSRGIGRAIVEDLARSGATVAFTYVSSADKAKELEAELATASQVKGFQSELSDIARLNELVTAIENEFGMLDILVNNAGIFASQPFEEVTESDFDQLFTTNVKGPFFLTQQLLPLMKNQGRIINVSSGSTRHHVPLTSVYAATKAALEQFTRLWFKELAPRGITVNSILPGYTATDWVAYVPEEQKTWMASQAAFGRLGSAQDISKAVLFLASHLGEWVTGQNIAVDGGL
ncbi:MAG: 3-oxoacyl-ACP reductase FabG [Leptolyngbya sp. SIO1D8]|nr:3-oxoacyl-ACP reductase FabG [Leptolyngbya sp. SIO1D8]